MILNDIFFCFWYAFGNEAIALISLLTLTALFGAFIYNMVKR